MIKVYSDGSNSFQAEKTKSAVMIYKNNELIHVFSQEHGMGYSDVAEYQAVLDGLNELIKLGLENEHIEWFNDSQFVMFQMQGKWLIRSNKAYSNIAKQCKELTKQFKQLVFHWIPREENKLCDEVSKITKSND